MTVLDGNKIAGEIQEKIKKEIDSLKRTSNQIPGLTVIIVGDNPASQAYVRKKHKIAQKLGINSRVIELDKRISTVRLIKQIKNLNQDQNVHAVLIQLPLPDTFKTWEILDHLDPGKDVDRFLPINLGKILLNRTEIYPCTPAGVLVILDEYQIDLTGLNVVMVGRSFIVGKPLASMLTNRNATVTICHSKTKHLAGLLRKADLVVAAIGKAGFITPDMVKKNVILIDVGQNFLYQRKDVIKLCTQSQQNKFEKKGYAITGDIHIDAFKKSSYYTPVPGGIGPMTVAMLMQNTLLLFKQKLKLE
ncbi:MAG: bifunctional 5,10-methylenetetrahydrofolate dehydrogenase/5,10-methenyltetrahydrofolate cyclohydrolase [Candidatus Aminicenantes bacterium]|nr:bifunctional 5,10-methylenetetrahydrofolate dehydrogenase/5,10-methenyltetrahydrofolate cyclohydrolase [Candidatus Aminicenantes bacterium]